MRILKFVVIAVLGASMALVGCTPKKNLKRKDVVSADSIVQKYSKAEASEKLTDLAEKLFLDRDKMYYADKLVTRALELNPENPRAIVYNAILEPQVHFRGVNTKLMHFFNVSRNYKRLDLLMRRQWEESEYREFPDRRVFLYGDSVYWGEGGFNTEKEILRFWDQYSQKLDKSRKTMIAMKDKEISVVVPRVRTGGEITKSCSATATDSTETTFELIGCEEYQPVRVSLNRADFEAMQHSFAYLLSISIFYAAYDLTGLNKVDVAALAKKEKYGQDAELMDLEVTNILQPEADFGKLRNLETVKSIGGLLSDFVAGIEWAKTIQGDLCKEGREKKSNRPGFLFVNGFCVFDQYKMADKKSTKSFEELQTSAHSALAGETLPNEFVGWNKKSEPIYTAVNYLAPIQKPIENLKKAITPTKYDLCGNAKAFADNTAAGYYPKGNLNEILDETDGFKNCEPSMIVRRAFQVK